MKLKMNLDNEKQTEYNKNKKAIPREDAMNELKCTALALNEEETAHALIYSRTGRGTAMLGGDAYPMQKNIDALEWADRDTVRLVLGDETAEVFGQQEDGFPAMLDTLICKRWQAERPGLAVLSCAPNEHNAQHLLEEVIEHAVGRYASPKYLRYLVSENTFCATLTDCAEWLIEADEKTAKLLPLPFNNAVRCVPDLGPYALRRTRMLGGAGAMAAVCTCLAGIETMGEAMRDADVRALLGKALTEEMEPDAGFTHTENLQYAVQVCSYLENAYGSEKWPEAGENLISRYIHAILPALTEYSKKNGRLPSCLAFSISALIMLYSGVRADEQGTYMLAGKDGSVAVPDRAEALQAFSRLSCDMPCEALAYAALSDCEIWGCDLREIDGLEELVTRQLQDMQLLGVCAAMREASKA
jgi:tagaturonate reductase